MNTHCRSWAIRLSPLACALALACKKPQPVAADAAPPAARAVDLAVPAPRIVDAGASRDLAIAAAPAVTDGGITPAFDGRPGWLVIADVSDRHARALARARELRRAGEPATVVQTILFANLRPRLFAVVAGRFDDRAAAEARLAALRALAPKGYVKESGAILVSTTPDAGTAATATRLIHLAGEAKHEDDRNPTLTITTGDGELTTRPDETGFYELWVATPGDVTVTMKAARERKFPVACSRPGATSFWAGRDEATNRVTASDTAILLDPLNRYVEQNPCD